jgi:hypothetical protein
MAADDYVWRMPRPRYMREAEPLARASSWKTPLTQEMTPQTAAYRMLTNKRMLQAEQERVQVSDRYQKRAALDFGVQSVLEGRAESGRRRPVLTA